MPRARAMVEKPDGAPLEGASRGMSINSTTTARSCEWGKFAHLPQIAQSLCRTPVQPVLTCNARDAFLK